MGTCESPEKPHRVLGAFQYLTIAVGCMIGVGWITVLGVWLHRAGPLGSIAGFLVGGIVIVGVAACYAELTGMMPTNGGDVVFAERAFGRNVAFFVGWFLILNAVAVVSFEALSFVWLTETLLPGIGSTAVYRVLDQTVTVQRLAIGLGAIGFMYALNRVGLAASARAQDWLTGFKLAVVLLFLATALVFGNPHRLIADLGTSSAEGHSVTGALWVVATSAFWLGGFQVIGQAAGERDSKTSLRLIGLVTTASVVIGVVFYMSVVVAATSAAPLEQVINSSLPAAAAARAAFRSKWGEIAVLLAGLAGVTATLNAFLLSGSRLSFAVAQIGFLPLSLTRADRRGVPVQALTGISLLATLGVLCGRGLLIPVVNTASMSLILSFVLACANVWLLRRRAPTAQRPFRVPGGVVLVAMTGIAAGAMAVFILLEPALTRGGFPIEWAVFLAWGMVGGIAWGLRRPSACDGPSSPA
jgi:basic amino acid/polyamine antiporter, APA family